MNEVSLLRLYLLRAMYLLVVVGLGIVLWPGIIHQAKPWSLNQGVINCMLAAFSLICALGLRYPLQMLPILFWELVWKALWLFVVALPAWKAGTMDAAMAANVQGILFVAIIPFVIPWRYAFDHYVKKGGDRWRNPGKEGTPAGQIQPQAAA